jgi:hypothetical protein
VAWPHDKQTETGVTVVAPDVTGMLALGHAKTVNID